MGSTYFLPLVANRQIANKLLLTGEIITLNFSNIINCFY